MRGHSQVPTTGNACGRPGAFRIGIDATRVSSTFTGIAVFGDAVLRSLPVLARAHPDWEFHVFVTDIPRSLQAALITSGVRVHALSRRHPVWVEQVSLPVAARRLGLRFDVFYSIGYPFGMAIPAKKLILQVHDVSPWRIPGQFSSVVQQYWRICFGTSIGRAGLVLTDTQFTSDEVKALFHVAADRMLVLPCPIRADFYESDANAPDHRRAPSPEPTPPYFLAVGSIQPRKNLIFLLEVFERACREIGGDFRLVIVAGGTWQSEGFVNCLKTHPFRARIDIKTGITTPQLVGLYARAQAVLFPSLYEGFGLPAVEAFALGVPVIASRIPALVEVTGGLARYASPFIHAEWIPHMAEVLGNGDGVAARDRFRARAGHFTLQAFTKRLEAILTHAAQPSMTTASQPRPGHACSLEPQHGELPEIHV